MLKSPSLGSAAFRDAGIYVMRSEHIYLVAACQPIGINGVGAHKHNDWLSFDLCVDGKPIIVDPGTYCYTGNIKTRRMFRSTVYHNTVRIDGREQTDIHDSMFGLINPHGKIRVLRWETDPAFDLLEAEHTGYTRLAHPVVHNRRFMLDKNKNQIKITDTFHGEGKHLLEWYLHLDIGLDCRIEDGRGIVCKRENPCLGIGFSGNSSDPRLMDGWVSRAYNKREKAGIIMWRNEVVVKDGLSFTQYFRLC